MITRNGIWVEVYGGSGVVPVADIPVSDYSRFFEGFAALMARPECHCVNYFAYPEGTGLLFVAMIADDSKHTVNIASYKYDGEVLPSLSNSFPALHS